MKKKEIKIEKSDSIKDKIDKFLIYLTTITKDQADSILNILNMDDETKAAFKFAKRIFEEKDDK